MSQVNNAKAIVTDVTGLTLSDEERAVFRDMPPAGFILFQRNCADPSQIRDLVATLRDVIGNADAPILIDQEGGTVSRLKAPVFQEFPAAKTFYTFYRDNPGRAMEALVLNAELMAAQLADLGITVNCAPVVDVPSPDGHKFLSASRVYGEDATTVSILAGLVMRSFLSCGVTPILKHIPGHGRATVDSHYDVPVVDADMNTLRETDFAAFKKLNEIKGAWAMTAHVIFSAIDDAAPATLSGEVFDKAIRGAIGFDGLVIADCVSMQALSGTMAERAVGSINAGCDLTLLCNQDLATRRSVLKAVPEISPLAQKRMAEAEKIRQNGKKQVDIKTVSHELEQLLNGVEFDNHAAYVSPGVA